MSTSRTRRNLRRERRIKRQRGLPKELVKQHPVAARMHLVFGRPIEACIAEENKVGSRVAKRTGRRDRKREKDMLRRQLHERHVMEQRKTAAAKVHDKAKRVAAKLKSTFTRKGVA